MFRSFFLERNFFYALAVLIILFVLSAFFPVLYAAAWGATGLVLVLTTREAIYLYRTNNALQIVRKTPQLFSMAADNEVVIGVKNLSRHIFFIRLIDEVPFGFSAFESSDKKLLLSDQSLEFKYTLKPLERGKRDFGMVKVFIHGNLMLCSRMIHGDLGKEIKVYPGIVQMEKSGLMFFSRISQYQGIRKRRTIGQGQEFDQIRNYVSGDDYRNINWKATARSAQIMTNQYQVERSQSVYCILDTGRSTSMAFDGLSLLDYSVNATLALSNVVIKSGDKAGFMGFGAHQCDMVKAGNQKSQIGLIASKLYSLNSDRLEPDYERLYETIRKQLGHRSLLILFTNFETYTAMERALPVIRKIAARHVLLVVFFENRELSEFRIQIPEGIAGHVDQAISEYKLNKMRLMSRSLRSYGVQTLLVPPQQLTLETINQYQRVKSGNLL